MLLQIWYTKIASVGGGSWMRDVADVNLAAARFICEVPK